MANKIMKTLTIDGVPMDAHDLPVGYIDESVATSVTVPGSTWTDLCNFQITKPGTYLLIGYVDIPPGTSTATIDATFRMRGTGLPSYMNTARFPGNAVNRFLIPVAEKISESQVPITVTLDMYCATSVAVSVYVAKLAVVRIETIVGGVIQRLKNLANSICYRPQFRMGVA